MEVILWAGRFQMQLSKVLHRDPGWVEKFAGQGLLSGRRSVVRQETHQTGATLPGSGPGFCHALSVWPWVNHSLSGVFAVTLGKHHPAGSEKV